MKEMVKVRKSNVLDVQVSCYASCSSSYGKSVNLHQWLITENSKFNLDELRGRVDFPQLKKTVLPAITVSGLFNNPRSVRNLINHTGLICIDIDGKDQIMEMDKIFNDVKQMKFVAYLGKSCSGKGLFAIIPIAFPEKHKEHLLSLIEYFGNEGIVLDKSCSDVCRLRVYSFDKDAYYNTNATVYEELKLIEKVNEVKQAKTSEPIAASTAKLVINMDVTVTDKRILKVINDIKYNHINIAEDYYVWMKIGMALYNTFGEEGRALYHIISSQSPKYDFDECNRNYDEMYIYHYNDVSIKSFFYIYNQAKKELLKKSENESLTKFNSVG